MVSEDSKKQLRRLLELREAKDVAKKAADNAKAEYDEAELDVYDALEEAGISGSLKVDLGQPWGTVSFSPRETFFGRVIDEEAAKKFFQKSMNEEAMTAPSIVKGRLHDEVRTRRELGQAMPPGVDWYANRGVTITREKK